MGEINAALALSQLKRIDEILARRVQVAEWYAAQLDWHPMMVAAQVEHPAIPGFMVTPTHKSWFLFPHYKPGHKQRSLADFRLFNTATQEDRDTALYPIWPMMTREEVEAQCRS